MSSDRGKYADLIDQETWEFIERTNDWYPPDTANYPIDRQRAIYDAMSREFFTGYPEGVRAEMIEIDCEAHSIPARHYSCESANQSAVVVYYHGGGFVVGGLESHDDVCAEICQRTGYELISVDYRLAPEHRFPAAFDDAVFSFLWAAKTFGKPVVLCGDSAGGNLSATVSHAARQKTHQPIGQVLIYPGLGGDMSKGSYVEHSHAPMLTTDDIALYSAAYSSRTSSGEDPRSYPLKDDDFSGLPPTVLIAAECDPLCSDCPDYDAKLKQAGINSHCVIETGLVHGYLRARSTVKRAGDSFDRIVDAVSHLGKGEWPY
ncbi:MAG: alpha/beta hydrolase [Pseudomonadota bacterium]